MEVIVSKFSHEKDAGRVAVQLAQHCFFGTRQMARSTAGSLDPTLMLRIKEIVLAKFGGRRSVTDREALWAKCKTAIGQKCKILRKYRMAHLP